ncbi:MAG: YdcF family protein [Clostridia bacterium]|nr:YdcF family protein [Clostridia bacterium]
MKKRIVTVVAVVLAALLIYIAICAVLICTYADNRDTRHADCAIVLGAGVGKSGPSPVFRERILHGVKLYESGQADFLIFTGGVGDGANVSEADTAKRFAVSCGVPEEVILLEEQSRYTHENLQFAKKLMDEHGLQTALIVSDPLHMKRAMLTARDTGMECYPSPTETSRYQSFRTKASFLVRETACYIGYRVYRIFD